MENFKIDESTTKAIIDSTNHHEDNLNKLKTTVGIFKNSTYQYMIIGNITIPYNAGECALCGIFSEGGEAPCKKCPLTMIGQNCNLPKSAWAKLKQAKTKEEAIIAEENMIWILKKLLEEYKIEKPHQAKKEVKGDKICPCLDYAGMMNFTQKGKPISDCCSCNGTGIVKEEETDKKINIGNYKCPKCNKNMIVYDVESLSPTLVNKVGYIIPQEIKVIINSTYKCNCGMTVIDKELITYYPNKIEE